MGSPSSKRYRSFMIDDILCRRDSTEENLLSPYSSQDENIDFSSLNEAKETTRSDENLGICCLLNTSMDNNVSVLDCSPGPIDFSKTMNHLIQARGEEWQFMLKNSLENHVWHQLSMKRKLIAQSKPRKGGQIRFTHQQTIELERKFDCFKYLTPSERRRLAKKLSLSERQVKTWFQNRRAKWRRIKESSTIDQKPLSFIES
ncbi:uncharacterized protein LOC141853392 [Brevipalpus obovatus]|uniref:uncharacterized protein LOC141853392 n=1 Tax=Brevipalpus obovatus TaxID=246614 RepID=UPI003D9F4BDF